MLNKWAGRDYYYIFFWQFKPEWASRHEDGSFGSLSWVWDEAPLLSPPNNELPTLWDRLRRLERADTSVRLGRGDKNLFGTTSESSQEAFTAHDENWGVKCFRLFWKALKWNGCYGNVVTGRCHSLGFGLSFLLLPFHLPHCARSINFDSHPASLVRVPIVLNFNYCSGCGKGTGWLLSI